MRFVSDLPDPVDVPELPIDQLGLMMLGKFAEGGGWSSRNLMLELNEAGYRDEAGNAMAEAFAWLGNRGLVAPDPTKNEWTAVTTTRLGQQVLADGPAVLHATERLQEGLHPLIAAKARRQFLMGEYEQAVFVSMKAVEVRVRSLGGFGDDVYGVDLMNKAFNRDAGILADQTVERGERDAMRSFFVGAYGLLRNPAGHREIDYDDPIEAAEAVQTASLLMRLLDKIERRITPPPVLGT
jgi:uncharacterized protein (TIGR02391 family)